MRFATLALCLAATACATTPPGETLAEGDGRDPYESFNRSMMSFNNGIDKYAVGPAATVYKTVTPKAGRDRVTDFMNNLGEPVTFANDLLQGKPGRAGETLARFGINTTLGLAGVWNAAGEFGIERKNEDFGQTLGTWGVGSGPFLVLPLLGPSTPRDFLGRSVDGAMDPLNWAEAGGSRQAAGEIATSRAILGGLNARVRVDPQIKALNEQPEPYVALRRIYLAQRESAIRNGQLNEAESYKDLPDFDEIPE
jgi:phospholipid-binding lipoprotein MlaA